MKKQTKSEVPNEIDIELINAFKEIINEKSYNQTLEEAKKAQLFFLSQIETEENDDFSKSLND